MSAETSNEQGAVANGTQEKLSTADSNHKAASESPTKPNGEAEALSGATESPSKKVTPKKGPAKEVQAKNEADSEKQATLKHDDPDEKSQSASKGKLKESPRKVADETASPSSDIPAFTEATDSGKRERRKIERFVDRSSKEEEAKIRRKSEVLAKEGVSLGEIERVAHFIAKAEPDGLKVIHGIIYGRPGSSKELRTNLKLFRGFAFEADSQEYKARLHRLKERHVKELKNACFALDLERNGNRDDLALRIIQFLMKPVDSGRPVPTSTGKKKRKSAKKNAKPKAKAETDSAKKRKVESESDNGDSLSESDESAPPATTSASKKARDEQETPKAAAAATKVDPWLKKLSHAIKSILEKADFSTTTMKVVLDQIRSRFPNMEVTAERKSFMRTMVRELLAAPGATDDAD